MQNEAKVQAAIQAFQSKRYKSIQAAACAFSVLASIVHNRLAGRSTCSTAHESA
jgi:hypothetical protein